VSAQDFVARAQVYRHHGYFPARELRAVSERLAAASVTEPQRMLRRFVELADAER
jgi:GMP synthase (glutamine-hydrolysing)